MAAQLQVISSEATRGELQERFERLRAASRQHTPGYDERLADLKRLKTAFQARLPQLLDAMEADFGQRSRHESELADGLMVLKELDFQIKNLRRNMRPERPPVGMALKPARTEIRWQPLGVIGVISPWNYPVQLALNPLIGAIAAGNRVMVKPSEHTPKTGNALAELLAEVFPADKVVTVLGGATTATAMTHLAFDHLVFTGSTEIGRKVMQACVPSLTPCTLELGGKSPVLIQPDYPLDHAVERVLAGKCLNAGQTCIAPDYVFVDRARLEDFITGMRAGFAKRYPDFENTRDYTAVINERQWQRLTSWRDEAKAAGARIEALHPFESAARRVMPLNLVINAPDNTKIMHEEIFGPMMIVWPYDKVEDTLDIVLARPRPLAYYLFDRNTTRRDELLGKIVAGGVTVNDTLLHFGDSNLPVGGVGDSGMGAYHGQTSFRTYSKATATVYQARFNTVGFFAPPYGKLQDWILRLLRKV